MDPNETGFLIFALGVAIFYLGINYRKKDPPSRSKSRKELISSTLGFTIELIGAYMYGKLDSVMILFGVITMVCIIWAGIDFLRYPKTTEEST